VTGVIVIRHPLIRHNLTRLRDRRTPPQEFRRLLAEVAGLMVYEATRSLRVRRCEVETPLERTVGCELEREVLLVPVLRAGLGMLDGILRLIPHARVGFLGLRREESTLEAAFYHESLPAGLERFEVLVMDPMLATGGSALKALDRLTQAGARRLRMIHLVAAPEGIRAVRSRYPRVPVFTAAIDRGLNERGFILPGLGDAGDRLFGT